MKRLIIIVVSFVLFAGNSVATDSAAPHKYKSTSKATALSTYGHLVPIGLGVAAIGYGSGRESGQSPWLIAGTVSLAVGVIAGPGAGHAYAGNNRRLWQGIGARVAIAGLSALMIAALESGGDESGGNFEIQPGLEDYIAGGFLLISVVLIEHSAIRDIKDAEKSARDFNRNCGPKKLSVAPAFYPDQTAAGVRVSMRF
ncbi:MAG: hypothetical protein AB1483_09580 [Candidatus Zixiibacteriota bacterium]